MENGGTSSKNKIIIFIALFITIIIASGLGVGLWVLNTRKNLKNTNSYVDSSQPIPDNDFPVVDDDLPVVEFKECDRCYCKEFNPNIKDASAVLAAVYKIVNNNIYIHVNFLILPKYVSRTSDEKSKNINRVVYIDCAFLSGLNSKLPANDASGVISVRFDNNLMSMSGGGVGFNNFADLAVISIGNRTVSAIEGFGYISVSVDIKATSTGIPPPISIDSKLSCPPCECVYLPLSKFNLSSGDYSEICSYILLKGNTSYVYLKFRINTPSVVTKSNVASDQKLIPFDFSFLNNYNQKLPIQETSITIISTFYDNNGAYVNNGGLTTSLYGQFLKIGNRSYGQPISFGSIYVTAWFSTISI
jgi:hypothetical protein